MTADVADHPIYAEGLKRSFGTIEAVAGIDHHRRGARVDHGRDGVAQHLLLPLRDLQVRYKQTIMGFGWAVFMPLINTAVFSVIFMRVAPLDTGDIPYPLFAFTGLLAAYIGVSQDFGETYGPLAGLIGLLLWTFGTALALFLGLSVAAQLEAVRARDPGEQARAGLRRCCLPYRLFRVGVQCKRAGAPVDEHFCPQCSRILALGRHEDVERHLGLSLDFMMELLGEGDPGARKLDPSGEPSTNNRSPP